MKSLRKFAVLCIAVFTLGCGLSAEQVAATPIPAQPETPAAVTPTYLPITTKDAPPSGPPETPQRLQPSDLVYRGAFRLPQGGERPLTFAYGGNAMTFNPSGDASGPSDGAPGSLFITGHDRIVVDVPDGSQVAEVSIPAPVIASDVASLPTAEFLQPFADVAEGFFPTLQEIPRIGLAYLDHPATGPLLHLAWGQHLDESPFVASHAWFSPGLSGPDTQGAWHIGEQPPYQTTGYLFEIPTAWADAYTAGRYLATGRFRDGGWGGLGPALFAYLPWTDASGTPAANGAHLSEQILLEYASSLDTENIECNMTGYQHPDEWEGGAWVTTPGGKSAILFAGTKSNGAKYWYGWINPAGPELPCVAEAMIGDFTVCRMADGSACPAEDFVECSGHNDYRGWWTTHFDASIILYDPADLARVAAGEIASWEPQPYASIDIDDVLFHNPAGVEADMLGTGDQRRFRIGDVAYDRVNGLLYILELFADEAQPVVHVWQISP